MNNNYQFIWKQKRSLINVESHLWQYIHHRDILGNQHTHSFLFAKKGIAEEHHRQKDNQRWVKDGKKYLNKAFVNKHLAQGERLRQHFSKFVKRLNTETLSEKSTADLKNYFLESCHYHARLRGYFKTSRGEFLTPAMNQLQAILKKITNDEHEIQNMIETLTTATKFDDINQEFADWVVILSNNCQEKILPHYWRFPWLVANTYNPVEIKRAALDKFKSDRQQIKKLNHELAHLKLEKKKLKARQQILLSKLKNHRAEYLSWLFQELSLERMRLKGGWSGSDYYYFPLYREISNRTGIPLNKIYSIYRISEIIKSLQKRTAICPSSELNKRSKAYVLLMNIKKISFISGLKAEIEINKRLFSHVSIISQGTPIKLTGQVANRGLIRGRVRIIIPGDLKMLHQDFQQFKPGEILVTTMTQPNMVPLMKKALAIVTDEGGIISHAAVIAREFNIPCIVGTSLATKALKNGDLVTIDPMKGTINK